MSASSKRVDNFDQGELFDLTLLGMPRIETNTSSKTNPKRPSSRSRASAAAREAERSERGERALQTSFSLPEDPPIRIVKSRRRKRNIAAYRQSGEIVISVPFRTTKAEISQIVPELVERVIAGEKKARKSESELEWRALNLLGRYLPEFHERAASISWRQMSERWGSCTTVDRTIRISDRLQSAPDYVLDYVLLHELIHLRTSGHGADFHQLLSRYKEMEKAEAYLEGFEAGERGS